METSHLAPHRLEFAARERAPGPFERAVAPALEPGLRPEKHQRPRGRHHEPGFEPVEAAVEAEAVAEEQDRGDEAGAEIVGECGSADRGEAADESAATAREE